MRFFSRFVFICNVCFIVAAILRLVELNNKAKGNFEGAIKYQPLESTLVVLGYGAIFFNLIFALAVLLQFAVKRFVPVPRWILFFNLVMLIVQFYYFFFMKI